jgi:flagellar export protein FliJ
MKNALKVLDRIKKFELDEQQRLLAQELTQEEKLQHQIDTLQQDYEKEKEFVLQNPGLTDFGIYTEQYLKKRKSLQAELAAVENKITQIRDTMADLFKEEKTYKIVDDNRQLAQQKESDRREQKMLDEIGTNAYIKKHQE